MDEINNAFTSITKAIDQSAKDFTECKDLPQKKLQAEIIKLLCESLDLFSHSMDKCASNPFDNYDPDDEDEDYDDDDDDYDLERGK
jgi:hypothetical protein